jgi:serine/threonine-protein kinase RsbW
MWFEAELAASRITLNTGSHVAQSAWMDGMEICIRNRVDEMPAIVTMVENFGIKHGISHVVINELNLVLDEVLSNILSYGYSERATGRIIVRLNYRSGEISAEVRDDGRPFDPLQVESPDKAGTVQSRRVGGLGIHFMKELMDNAVYARVGNENRLVLVKKLPT